VELVAGPTPARGGRVIGVTLARRDKECITVCAGSRAGAVSAPNDIIPG